MKFRIKGVPDRVFESSGDAYDYIIEHEDEDVSMEDIEEIPEEEEKATTIEESPEESPSEVSVISEKRLLAEAQGIKALEEYDEYDEATQKQLLQQALNLTQKNRENTEVNPRLKGLKETYTTRNYIQGRYQEILEKLSDVDSQVCPLCNREWRVIEREMKENLKKEELSFRKEYLSFREQHKNLAGKFPMIRLFHCKASHPSIIALISKIFEVSESERRYDDTRRDDSESCSKENLEELSKEELTTLVRDNPELRKRLFKRYMLELKKKSRERRE